MQYAGVVQQQRHEQASQTAVAVQEGMDGLELHVRQPRPDEDGEPVVSGVQEALERRHAVGHGGVGRRHEDGVAGPGPADPVLRAAEFAGGLGAAASRRQQDGVHLADQAVRQREALAQAPQAVLEGGDVVRDFDDVIQRNAGCLRGLEEQQVRQRRLHAFDLRGEHGFLAHVDVEEEAPVREERRDAVEPTHGKHRGFQRRLQCAIQVQGGHGGQRRRHEGANLLAARARYLVGADSFTPHDGPAVFETPITMPASVILARKVNNGLSPDRYLTGRGHVQDSK